MDLQHCKKCNQMTNHIGVICQRCGDVNKPDYTREEKLTIALNKISTHISKGGESLGWIQSVCNEVLKK